MAHPLKTQAEERQWANVPPVPRTHHKASVLIVDDDAAVVVALKRALRDRFRVEGALNANEAADLIFERGAPFAAIVSDMRMPGLDGISFLKRVKMRWPTTQRILLTGAKERGVAIDAINEGQVFRFLQKPCPTDELRRALEDAVAEYERLTLATSGTVEWQSNFYDELQTPLHNITGIANLMEEQKLSPERLFKAAQYIRETGEAMLSLTEAHMALVQIRRPGHHFTREKIALGDLIKAIELRHVKGLTAAGIGLKLFQEPGLEAINANTKLLNHAIGGLIGNTSGLLGVGGVLSVRFLRDPFEPYTALIEVIGQEEEGRAEYLDYVSAGKSGQIATEAQVHASLQLSLAATVADLHGGRLTLERVSAGRTRGVIRLPDAIMDGSEEEKQAD